MDGTPDYMHIPSAACRIAANFPDARLVAVLRNPAEVGHQGAEGWQRGAPRPRAPEGGWVEGAPKPRALEGGWVEG